MGLFLYNYKKRKKSGEDKVSREMANRITMSLMVILLIAGCYMQAALDEKTKTVLTNTADENMRIAISFDDGPNEIYTPMLLEGLKKRGVKATFFLLGKEVEKYPEIVARIYEEGHLIGTHSYEHVNLHNLSSEEAIAQVDRTNSAICAITGENPEYIRPPFGSFQANLDYQTKMIEVLWDIDPLDWKTDNSDVIAKRVTDVVTENDIILLHDASESSVKAAFKIIDALTARGYEFVTVDEIVMD
jgi:peptidoglycan/xylan/chitin deacetylase (PgdA/CDA1 family)